MRPTALDIEFSKEAAKQYAEAVETFLREDLGLDETTIGECEIMRHVSDDPLTGEIWRNGERIGRIVCRWESRRLVIRFFKSPKGNPCQSKPS